MTALERKHEWKGGDGLSWCGEHWHFLRFDPAYPRAMCQAEKGGRVVAIDIRTAKHVFASVERKRQERQRRKEAGEVRVEVWLGTILDDLDCYCASTGNTRGEVIERALREYIQ